MFFTPGAPGCLWLGELPSPPAPQHAPRAQGTFGGWCPSCFFYVLLRIRFPHNDADGVASCLERRSTEAANRTKPPPTSIGVRDYRYPTRNLQRYPQTTAWRHCYHVLFLNIYRPRAGIKATVLAHLGYTNVRALLSPK